MYQILYRVIFFFQLRRLSINSSILPKGAHPVFAAHMLFVANDLTSKKQITLGKLYAKHIKQIPTLDCFSKKIAQFTKLFHEKYTKLISAKANSFTIISQIQELPKPIKIMPIVNKQSPFSDLIDALVSKEDLVLLSRAALRQILAISTLPFTKSDQLDPQGNNAFNPLWTAYKPSLVKKIKERLLSTAKQCFSETEAEALAQFYTNNKKFIEASRQHMVQL